MRKKRDLVPTELSRKRLNGVIACESFDFPAFNIRKNSADELKIYLGAEAALMQFNHKNGTDYKFLDVVKSTHAMVRGEMFYVTFVGIARKARRYTTFEAKVWADLDSETKVTLCRKKLSGSNS